MLLKINLFLENQFSSIFTNIMEYRKLCFFLTNSDYFVHLTILFIQSKVSQPTVKFSSFFKCMQLTKVLILEITIRKRTTWTLMYRKLFVIKLNVWSIAFEIIKVERAMNMEKTNFEKCQYLNSIHLKSWRNKFRTSKNTLCKFLFICSNSFFQNPFLGLNCGKKYI